MKVTEVSPGTIRDLWSGCAPRIAASQYLDEGAHVLMGAIYDRFVESLVLVRAFLTVPFQSLPERQRGFARELAQSVQLDSILRPSTPIHSLLATRGCVDDWNDPQKSRGHVAIPLLSEDFVGSIPMMSRLLKELGLPLTWVQDPGAAMVRGTIGSDVGFFHVQDAASATDELGRRIIPAQAFVANYAVKSVFAVGGVVFGGAVMVIIFFSRDPVEVRTVRTFMPLINLLKAVVVSQCSLAKVFRPASVGGQEASGSVSASEDK